MLSQEFVDIEYIIIDGKSTDGTVKIIKEYKNKVAKIISEPDNGIYNAMNKGIKLATGDIIAFLNSDDVYAKQTIVSEMVNFIEDNNLDAAYGDIIYIGKGSDRIKRYWKTGHYREGLFKYGWTIPHPTFFCRKDIFEKYGKFNELLEVAADFELLLRFVERYKIKIAYLPQTVVKMSTGGKANTFSGVIQGNKEIIASFKSNNIKLTPLFFITKPILKLSQILKIYMFKKL